jgi:3,4-dihydroxy-2-butanone 4-phosphate synthase
VVVRFPCLRNAGVDRAESLEHICRLWRGRCFRMASRGKAPAETYLPALSATGFDAMGPAVTRSAPNGLLRRLETREGLVPSTSPLTGERFDFARIDDAIADLRAGRMIVVVDDEDRENEGDLTMAAEMITPQAINFMATQGRGLICLAMTGQRLDDLGLGLMVPENSALHNTAFTVSIDFNGCGATTGISAYDRAQTIKAAVDPTTRPQDFARPGHVFPLRARPGGVLERRGQTEAAVDLARMAGLQPAGVICEIVNDDGTMARVPDLVRFCKKHGLMMITVADLARYRRASDDVQSVARRSAGCA